MVDHEVNEPSDADGFAHVPVLLHRADDLLGPAITAVGDGGAGAYMIDATLGLGGHSEFFLGKYPGLHLIGLDRDTNALRIASERLAPFADRTTFVHTTYDGIEDALEQAGLQSTESVHAILFDLGVSSMQLDEADRGFCVLDRRSSRHADGSDGRADRGRGPEHLQSRRPCSHSEHVRRRTVRGKDCVRDPSAA